MNSLGTILFGLVVAMLAAVVVYRDTAAQQFTRRIVWSLPVGAVSGVGAALSYRYASEIVFGVHYALFGSYAITNPFTIPLTYVFLSLLITLLTLSVYRFSASLTSSRRKAA